MSFFASFPPAGWIKIPSYPACFVCGKSNPIGLKIDFYGKDGEVIAEFVFQNELCGYSGIVHGGVIAAILDEGMGWTGWIPLQKYYLTVELKVKYIAPVRPCEKYFFRGEFIRRIGTIYLARGEIKDSSKLIVAQGEGKYYIKDEEGKGQDGFPGTR